jgi:L-rhamnose mutarotase
MMLNSIKGILPMKRAFVVAGMTCMLLAVGHSQYDEHAGNATNRPAFKRYCLTLDLKDDPKLIKEYKYWHQSNHIWPEIPKGIREVGITDMEIYLLGTRLFMIMETTPDFDFDTQMAKLSQLPKQKEWEAFVSKFQKANPGEKSSEKWKLMERIFKLPEVAHASPDSANSK